MNILIIKIGKQRRKFIFTYIYYHENENLKYLIDILRMKLDLYVIVILGLIRRINRISKKMTTTTFYLYKYQLKFYLKNKHT
jgi:hypothetical protein